VLRACWACMISPYFTDGTFAIAACARINQFDANYVHEISGRRVGARWTQSAIPACRWNTVSTSHLPNGRVMPLTRGLVGSGCVPACMRLHECVARV